MMSIQGIIVDFETNGFHGSSVLSVAAIKIVADWSAGIVQKTDNFARHYHPVERWNRHAQAVNKLSSSKIDQLRGRESYPIHYRDDSALSAFASDSFFAVAHNAAFDSHFAQFSVPWICTMRLAGGNLTSAALARGIQVDPSRLHQAMYDTEVCLALFAYLLREGRVPYPCR